VYAIFEISNKCPRSTVCRSLWIRLILSEIKNQCQIHCSLELLITIGLTVTERMYVHRPGCMYTDQRMWQYSKQKLWFIKVSNGYAYLRFFLKKMYRTWQRSKLAINIYRSLKSRVNHKTTGAWKLLQVIDLNHKKIDNRSF